MDSDDGDDLDAPAERGPSTDTSRGRNWDQPRIRGGKDKKTLNEGREMPPASEGAIGRPGQNSQAAPKSPAIKDEDLKKALAPKPAPEAKRRQALDVLFERLRDASTAEEAQQVAGSIEKLWLQSPSDTATLLMERATASIHARQISLALSLFDKLVLVEPEWAEAWNQRAAARYIAGDTDGAMADIKQAVKLEPRHFGALAGMGMILRG
ncbi:MAG: hypothetical protein L0Y60_16525, partial [Beijerinckiaceae bacterium]|nr:hypothetical protein [Beijerinckiaceae bacterium]